MKCLSESSVPWVTRISAHLMNRSTNRLLFCTLFKDISVENVLGRQTCCLLPEQKAGFRAVENSEEDMSLKMRACLPAGRAFPNVIHAHCARQPGPHQPPRTRGRRNHVLATPHQLTLYPAIGKIFEMSQYLTVPGCADFISQL